jgi:hypothetical protein
LAAEEVAVVVAGRVGGESVHHHLRLLCPTHQVGLDRHFAVGELESVQTAVHLAQEHEDVLGPSLGHRVDVFVAED